MSNQLDSYWTQLGLDIDGKDINDYAGWSVSLSKDGTTVAIGAKYSNRTDEIINTAGRVYIYKYIDNSWSQIGEDIIGKLDYETLVDSVSLNYNGTILAIGISDNNNMDGVVRVYQYNNSNNIWNQLGEDIMGEDNYDRSGKSISISNDGTLVAIGATNNSNNRGHIRVYKYENSSWIKLGQDLDGEVNSDKFGYSVALSGDGTTVAGSSLRNDGVTGVSYDDRGSVRVYKFIDSSWIQLGGDIDGENEGEQIGKSVSLNQDGTIISIGTDNNTGSSGIVRIYKYINNTWNKLGSDIQGEAQQDHSGISTSLNADGTRVAIGAYNNRNGLGHVRIYKYIDNSWLQVGQDIDGEGSIDNSGFSVSLSADGKKVAIGAPQNKGLYGQNSGQVRVYEIIEQNEIPVSNICFPSGTPINTDQGIIEINKINSDIHTIRGNKIEAITKTVTQDKYLVCIEKDSLAKNIPSQKTIISKNHGLLYNRKIIPSKELLKLNNKGIYKLNYNGEILYNVLLQDKHDKMIVNNLICETLDPKNSIAEIYYEMKNANLNLKQREQYIKLYNDYVITNKIFR